MVFLYWLLLAMINPIYVIHHNRTHQSKPPFFCYSQHISWLLVIYTYSGINILGLGSMVYINCDTCWDMQSTMRASNILLLVSINTWQQSTKIFIILIICILYWVAGVSCEEDICSLDKFLAYSLAKAHYQKSGNFEVFVDLRFMRQ